MNYGVLVRRHSDNEQTLGHFTLYESKDVDVLMSCYILELDNENNKVRSSRIPAGIYDVVKRWSRKYGNHYHIKDVENRSLILIHIGNYHRDILGCLLPGRDVTDIDGDGFRDVTSSRKAMNELNRLAGKEWKIEIIDRDDDN